MHRGHKNKFSGFTLLEVIIAITILSFIMMTAALISFRSYSARERFDKRDELYHQGMVMFKRMGNDIEMAFLARWATQAQQTGTGTLALTTQTQTKSQFKTFFIGEENSIRLTTMSHLRMAKDARESDQCKVSYEMAPSSGSPGLYDLMRREDVWLDDTSDVKGPAAVVARGLRSIEMEYYDERKFEWGREWDTEKVGWQWKLPQAVKITITFPNPVDETKDVVLSTSVVLPMSAGVIEM